LPLLVDPSTQTLDASLRTIAMSRMRTPSVREGSSAVPRTGFPESELKRLAGCLDRLLPHIRQGDIALTGGVAIELGLAEIGHKGFRTRIADLDCVAGTLDAVAPSVCDAFLVSHYHAVRPGVPKFMLQLVDPVSGICVDVFPDFVGSLARSRVVQIRAQYIKMLTLDDILNHKLQTVSKASRANPVDPKHADDAHLLGEVLGRPISAIEQESLVTDVYGTDEPRCERCRSSLNPLFPLAPKREIFSLLGWPLGADLLSPGVVEEPA
jgi:hypothetical protein